MWTWYRKLNKRFPHSTNPKALHIHTILWKFLQSITVVCARCVDLAANPNKPKKKQILAIYILEIERNFFEMLVLIWLLSNSLNETALKITLYFISIRWFVIPRSDLFLFFFFFISILATTFSSTYWNLLKRNHKACHLILYDKELLQSSQYDIKSFASWLKRQRDFKRECLVLCFWPNRDLDQ